MGVLVLSVGLVGCAKPKPPEATDSEPVARGPVPLVPPPPKRDGSLPDPRDEARVARTVERWGGKVTRDASPAKAVTALDLNGLTVPLSDDDFRDLGRLKVVTSLDVGKAKLSPAHVKEVARLASLTSLTAPDANLTDASLKDLAALTQLTALDVSRNPISDAGLKELATLTNLTTLNVSGTHVTDAGLKALAPLKKLTSVTLNTEVSDDTLAALRGANLLHALPTATTAEGSRPARADEVASLNLRFARVTEQGLKNLAPLTSLTHLDLSLVPVTDAGLEHLTQFKKLNSLVLTDLNVTDKSLATLRASGVLHALKAATGPKGQRPTGPDDVVAFDLRGTRATSAAVKELAGFRNLAALNLAFTEMSDDGLAKVAAFPHLTALYLGRSKVTDAGLKELAPLKKLSVLALNDTEISDDGLKELTALPALTSLTLARTRVTDEGVAAFKQARPNCTVER